MSGEGEGAFGYMDMNSLWDGMGYKFGQIRGHWAKEFLIDTQDFGLYHHRPSLLLLWQCAAKRVYKTNVDVLYIILYKPQT